MDNTVELIIPAHWLKELSINQDELRQALMLGLAQLRQQQASRDTPEQVVQALLGTGRVRHLSAELVGEREPRAPRQDPPVLPGPPVSEILIAQRRGNR